MAYYRRSAWTTLPNRAVAIKGRQRHVTAHYPGFSTSAQRVNNYSLQQCFALVRGWDSMHRRSGYTAIAYNFFITPHGHIIEGRGFRQNGANGTGAANRTGLSMQFIVGNTEPLTAGHVRGACELLAMIAREGHATSTIYGHRHCGLTLLMLTPEMAGRAGLREGCRHEQAEEVHAGVPPGGCGFGAGYGPTDRACGRGDRCGRAAAGPLGPART